MSQITQTQRTAMANDELDKDPTLSDLLKVMDKMSTDIDERFDKIEITMTGMATKTDLAAAVERIDHIENQMVTKDYLDEKLHDLKGDLIVITRKEDQKVNNVVGLLQKKKIFSAQEAAEVLSTTVFQKAV